MDVMYAEIDVITRGTYVQNLYVWCSYTVTYTSVAVRLQLASTSGYIVHTGQSPMLKTSHNA
jgi:hypothetical protein